MKPDSRIKQFCKQAFAVFLNIAVCSNQLLADLPPITFDSAEWISYQTVGANPATGWQLLSGDASVSAMGSGFNGGKALRLPVNSQQETKITRTIPWVPTDTTAFIDLKIKPAADPSGSLSSFFVNGTQLAFQVPAGSNVGEIWVYHGNDPLAVPSINPQQWVKTVGSFNVSGTTATAYQRVTLRHDYQRNLWDLFIEGKLAAVNLAFDGRSANLTKLDLYGSRVGDTLIDDISALTTNMLFPDADKDGLPDAWEIANGSNPNLYDRDQFKPGTSSPFINLYMDSLWPTGGINTSQSVPASGGIPPLTLATEAPHQAVGALKGSLSVGGDGSANYSIPIDIPKGTGGMEPKLSLGYSSSGGNGMMGVGWNLSGLQRIVRGPATAAKDGTYDPADFDANDRFFLDGERLVCVTGSYGAAGSEYRTEMDSYARITAVGVGPTSWKVETKAGLTMFLGETADSKVAVSEGTLSWGVTKVQDSLENFYTVEYARDAPTSDFDFINYRIAAIRYSGNMKKSMAPYCSVEFAYEPRTDISRSYTTHAGYLINMRLAKILVKTGSYVNHSYKLAYSNSFQSRRSFLTTATKLIQDSPSLAVPPSQFSYDGIAESEALWRDPGESNLPVYGNLDSSSWVNSAVTTESNGTTIQLVGDVARAYKLPIPGITLYSDTMIQFEFKSTQLVSGALIGLDQDTQAGTYTTTTIRHRGAQVTKKLIETNGAALYQIGGVLGTGTYFDIWGQAIHGTGIQLSDLVRFFSPPQPYSTSEGWKTFTLPIGSLGAGLRNFLVLACVDENSSDGVNDASFRNVRIYRSATQQPTDVLPIVFDVDTELPRFSSGPGDSLGVTALDMNGDGLVDLTDWRVQSYNNSGANPPYFKPNCTGSTFRNVGGTFVSDPSLTPPSDLPLGICSQRTNGDTASYYSKHLLLAQPMDVDGDGNVDYCVSSDIRSTSGNIRNEYTFQTQINGVWTQRPEWKLPFVFANTQSSASDGGKVRAEHFIWSDINVDGYSDLIVRTTGEGELYSSTTGPLLAAQKIVGTSGSAVFLNKGKNGPGWIRDDSYNLPEPMLWGQKDISRRLVDLDGDGILEISEAYVAGANAVRHTYRMNQTGIYRWNSTPGLANPPASVYDFDDDYNQIGQDPGSILMDVNGDGLVDIVKSRKVNYTGWAKTILVSTAINTSSWNQYPWKGEIVNASDFIGRLFDWDYSVTLPLKQQWNSTFIDYGFQQMDMNGDGLTDILYSDVENAETPGSDNTAIVNTGNGWSRRDAWGLPGSNRIYYSAADRETGKRHVKFMDLNGDDFPDLITNIIGQTPKVWFNQCRPEVLKCVTDGFGSELQVAYSRLNDPTPTAGFGSRVYEKGTAALPAGQSAIIDSRFVVSSYSESDGQGGRRIRAQRYGDLRYDRFNEASLGFGWVEAKDLLNGQLTRTDYRRDYPFGGSPERTRTWVDVKPSDIAPAFVGVTAGLKCLSEETATFAEMPTQVGGGGTIRRPVQIGSVKTLCDLKGGMVSQTTTTQALADFDPFGFVKKSTVTSLDGTTVTTTSDFNHTIDPAKWFLGRLASATVVKSGQGQAQSTKASSFTYSPTTGLLKTETVEPGNALSVTKSYHHDDFGNVTSTTVTGSGLTRSSTSTYDPQGRFLLSESNSLGHIVLYNYNSQSALLLSTTDIAGKTTSFGYDAYGTQTRTFHPDGTQTGESTAYSSNAALPPSVSQYITNPIVFVRAKQTSAAPVAKVYFDRLGREVVAESTILRDANSNASARYSKVYTLTQYDTLGRKTLLSQAFGAGDNPNFSRFYYDVLSRPLITQHADGTSDQALALDTVQLAGQPVTYSKGVNAKTGIFEQWRDQHERMIQSSDPSGQTTLFEYDLENRLLKTRIANVLLLTNTFDKFGNKTSVNEANSGTSSSVYNAFAEVTSSTNAKGQSTSFSYDSLGRPLTVTKPEGAYTTEYLASGPAIGSPWRTTGPSGYQETISYDSLGRPLATTKTQFGETFTSSTVYDALGRTVSTTDAGGLTTLNDYDPQYSIPIRTRIGLGIPGAGTVLWQAGTFDSRGRALTQTLAQGVTASATYNPTTGLVNSTAAAAGAAPLQNKSYTWDPLGNLTARTDVLTGRIETFTYDASNRVTQAAVSGSGSLPVSNFTYASNGNLLTKGTANLIYGGTRPHAVSSATIKGVNRAYTYDAAGYVTSDSKRTYGWTSFGQLSSLDYLSAPALQNLAGTQIYASSRVQTNFQFDAEGNRAHQIKQRIAANDSRILEETAYLGSYEREIHSTRTSGSSPPVTTKTIHRHSIGGMAVYTRTQLPGIAGQQVKLTTILKDHLGSTDVLYTATWNGSAFVNATTERQSFDAWGERRDPTALGTYRATDSDAFRTSAQDYDRGYTGHEQLDDSGLIHMNGRIYDPELGRMLSPDPFVQVPEFSQNFNRYSYVMNNPLNLTDPTGFSWLGNIFKKVGNWIKENWRTIVVIIVAVVLIATGVGGVLFGALYSSLGVVLTPAAYSFAAGAFTGALVGAISGGLSAALAGGNLGDVLRGALIGGVQGAITGGYLHGIEQAPGVFNAQTLEHIVGHGVVGGAANVAMGGKFGDGFLSAAASAAASNAGLLGNPTAKGPGAVASRTIRAGVVGGTASALGGGKFANGAYTSAFQHLLNMEFNRNLDVNSPMFGEVDPAAGVNFGARTDPFTEFLVGGVGAGGAKLSMFGARQATGIFARVGAWFSSNFAAKTTVRAPLWTSTKSKTAVENAFGHWKKHGSEFPEFQNAKQYVEGTQSFFNSPAAGTMSKIRPNGDTLFYNPTSNTFGVRAADGAPRTMFRPTDGINYWNKQ